MNEGVDAPLHGRSVVYASAKAGRVLLENPGDGRILS